jgi:hypothetical protein
MSLAIITPVGPGHEEAAERCIHSVQVATAGVQHVRHIIVEDHAGRMGRSYARNLGMVDGVDWYFFLDADDTMMPGVTDWNDVNSPATFGAVCLDRQVFNKNVYPCGWHEVATRGARGTLSMGFFVKASLARQMRFNEKLDAGEDFDFYMRLPKFTKIEMPLVDIGYSLPSAGGPRGYDRIDWIGICNGIIASYVTKDPRKYDLRGDAVLAKAGSPVTKPRTLSGTLLA